MYKIENFNEVVVKILSKIDMQDKIVSALVSFGDLIENIPNEEYQKIGISSNSVKEKVFNIIKVIQSSEIDFNTYSGVYPFTFSGDVRSLFVQKRLGRCKINTFS